MVARGYMDAGASADAQRAPRRLPLRVRPHAGLVLPASGVVRAILAALS